MTGPKLLRGIELRYVLTTNLAVHGAATITEMIDLLEFQGFAVADPAPKSVSDALRWEVRRGRARWLRRGLYGPGQMPRSTEHYIHKRVMALRDEARRNGSREENAYQFWLRS
ncbi:hypothetical protein [Mycolicibacterium sp. XJ1819]